MSWMWNLIKETKLFLKFLNQAVKMCNCTVTLDSWTSEYLLCSEQQTVRGGTTTPGFWLSFSLEMFLPGQRCHPDLWPSVHVTAHHVNTPQLIWLVSLVELVFIICFVLLLLFSSCRTIVFCNVSKNDWCSVFISVYQGLSVFISV